MSAIDREVEEEGRRGKNRSHSVAADRSRQKTQVDKLVDVLKGGKEVTPQEQQLIDSFRAGYGLSEADPLWLMILPPLLRGGGSFDAGEVRELIQHALVQAQSAGGKNNLGPRFDQLEESTSDLRDSVNTLNLKLEKNIQRGVVAALSGLDQSGGIQQKEVLKAIRDGFDRGFEQSALLSWPVAAGALAFAVAVGFLGGIFVNKWGYEKYVAELEGKVAVYQQTLQQQPQKK